MTIIRKQFALFVCLAAACGGPLTTPGGTFSARDREAVAATADSPGQAEIVCNTKVTFFGRSGAAVGATVTAATFDSRMVRRTCAAKVASDRTWSCTQTLADGGYTWTAQVGSDGPLSSQVDFIVNNRGYAAPTIDHTPSPTNDPRPVLTGTVSSELVNHGFHLEVTENGKTICILDPVKSTNWSCPLTTPLADGPHLLTTDVDFKNGDEATPWGNPNAFVVKTSIGKPTLTPIPTPTSTNLILFSGTGEPGAVVTVSGSATATLCQSTATAGGRWGCMADAPLADGAHAISVAQQDAAGNVSGPVTASFVIDTHVPAAPVLDAPPSPSAVSNVTFTGTGEAGAHVSVLDSYSRLLCSATVAAAGAWSCSSGVADGDYLLTAVQVTAVGRPSGPSASVPLSVRTLIAPLFDALASPTRDASPLLTGHAQTGAVVSVYLGEAVLCAGAADAGGRWSCLPASKLADGAYLLLAQVGDGQGHASSPSAARALVVDTTPPAAPVLEQPASPTRLRQPVISGTAEAGASVAVVDATSGAPMCRASASASGAFQCAPATLWADGEHRVTATATDLAGNTSLQAQPVGVVIAEPVVPPPIIESPANGTALAQRRPEITGTTAAGTLVEVSVDGASYVAQVDRSGQWMLSLPADLALGSHSLSALATDPAQNASEKTTSEFQIVDSGVARGGCASGGVPAPLLAVLALLLVPARRRKALWLTGAATLALAPAASKAQAIDVSVFRPAAGGDGLAATEGARPPIDGEPRLELRTWTDYAVHPLTFQRSSGSEQPLVRNRVTQWLGAQVHLVGPLSLSAQVPITVTTGGDLSNLPPSYQGPTELSGGLADVRLTPRLSLLRQERAGIDLGLQMSLQIPTGSSETLSSDGSVHAEGLIALGADLGRIPAGSLDLLANAYVRSRPVRDFLEVRSGTEAGLRAGLGWILDPVKAWVPRRLYTELEGSTFLRAGFASGSAPAEWRLGTTFCPVGDLAIDVAGGGALTDGVGAPRARFLFGLGWSGSACARRNVAPAATQAQPIIVQVPAPPQPVAQALPLPPAPVVVDRDGDGIPDVDDACPEQAGPAENHGCPPGVPWRVIVSATTLEILDRVHFASGKATIEKRSWVLLDQVAAVIQSHPALLSIQVEGHTDDRGGASYNLLLSQARATSVADYLVSRGVARERLVARGFGPTRPVGSNGTPEGRAANRRVAFTVLKTQAREIEAQRPPDS